MGSRPAKVGKVASSETIVSVAWQRAEFEFRIFAVGLSECRCAGISGASGAFESNQGVLIGAALCLSSYRVYPVRNV